MFCLYIGLNRYSDVQTKYLSSIDAPEPFWVYKDKKGFKCEYSCFEHSRWFDGYSVFYLLVLDGSCASLGVGGIIVKTWSDATSLQLPMLVTKTPFVSIC